MENSQLANVLGNLINKLEEIKNPFFPVPTIAEKKI